MGEFLWVTNTPENRAFYNECPKQGLYARFAGSVSAETKCDVQRFLRYLRREFYFPVKINIYFTDQEKYHSKTGGYCYGVFFSNDERKQARYPQIFVPARMKTYDIRYSLCFMLTRYFQWYFMLEEQKAPRSISAQAAYYAKRVVTDYYEENSCE